MKKSRAAVKKSRTESVPTAIRLSRDDYDRLRDVPGGVAGGIRRGLEWLESAERADEPTRQFARLIFAIAREVELEVGAAWHADAGAYRTFRRAMNMVSAKWRPSGVPDNTLEEVELTPFEERPHASHPTNDTDALAVWIAHDVIEAPDDVQRASVRSAREQTLKQIIKLQRTRGDEDNG